MPLFNMNGFWKDEPVLANELSEVGSLIRASIDNSHGFVRNLLASQVNRSGKMLRPALVLIGGRLGSEEQKQKVKQIATVLEMIHIASLIHDDIIDNAKTRRGLPTLNALVGPKQAVLAGDYMLSKAMSLVAGKEGDLQANSVANAFSRLCQSELDQDANQGNFFITKATYLRRIAGKTAALFALSSYAGAAVAQADKKSQYSMHRIGYLMGMAFQIQDDILDYEGSSDKLGKEVGRDLLNGIPTLPFLEALQIEKSFDEKKRKLHQLMSKPRLTKKRVRKALQLITNKGGVEKAKETALKYANRAKDEIKLLGNAEVERLLTNLFEKLNHRKI